MELTEYFEDTESGPILAKATATAGWMRHRQGIAPGERRGLDPAADQPD